MRLVLESAEEDFTRVTCLKSSCQWTGQTRADARAHSEASGHSVLYEHTTFQTYAVQRKGSVAE